MQASVDGLPDTAYWVLDLEPADGHVYGYGWMYACTDLPLGAGTDEFVYFFSRTSTLPQTLENAWLARSVFPLFFCDFQ